MAALTHEIVANWRNELAARIAPATVVRDLATLSTIINHARREWGVHMSNPVHLARKPTVPPGRCRVLSADEEVRLLEAAAPIGRRSPWLQPAIILSIETAMRRRELLALAWANVDLERRTAFLPMTKNGSARTVPLSSRAIATLTSMPRSADGRVIPMSAAALMLRFKLLRERAVQPKGDCLLVCPRMLAVAGSLSTSSAFVGTSSSPRRWMLLYHLTSAADKMRMPASRIAPVSVSREGRVGELQARRCCAFCAKNCGKF
ncbi:integrase [Paraburkholderia bryophila]|uniref:Integrase n=2 Tax=Paraburkholderia bryophila TaxID=420952 RepID=A0A7Z0B725_9BURK|nr:integrase [Paraburkholderia bryophila]